MNYHYKEVVSQFIQLYYHSYDQQIDLLKNLFFDNVFISFHHNVPSKNSSIFHQDFMEFSNFSDFYCYFNSLYHICQIQHTNIKYICQPIDQNLILIKVNGDLLINHSNHFIFCEIFCIKNTSNNFFINNLILNLKNKSL